MILLAMACGNNDYPPELPLDDQYTQCSVDADCVRIELGCCDECNGGFAVVVNEDSVKEVQREFGQRCSPLHGCTLVGCIGTWELACADGFCDAAYSSTLTDTDDTSAR